MTGELHCIIVKAGIEALRSLPKEKQIELIGFDYPNIDKLYEVVYNEPVFQSEMDRRAMDIILRAAKEIEPNLYKEIVAQKNQVIKFDDISICPYDSGNISITQYWGTSNNRQIAYYNAEEKSWYAHDGTRSTVHATKKLI